MNISEKELDQIDQWLDGKLAAAATAQLERRIDLDADFAEAIQLHVRSRLAIRQAGADQLKQSLHQRLKGMDLEALSDQLDMTDIHTEAAPKLVPLYRRPWIWGVAAAIAFLVVAVWSLQSGVDAEPNSLYAAYMEEPAIGQVRSNNPETDLAWQSVVASYQAKDYGQVLDQLYTSSPDSFRWGDQGKILAAISLLELNQAEQAIPLFSQIDTKSLFGDQARWYQGLAHLKLNQWNQAYWQFTVILQTPGHYKHQEALELIQELEKMAPAE